MWIVSLFSCGMSKWQDSLFPCGTDSRSWILLNISLLLPFILNYCEGKNTSVRIQNQNTLGAFRIHLWDIKKSLRKQINLLCWGIPHTTPTERGPLHRKGNVIKYLCWLSGKKVSVLFGVQKLWTCLCCFRISYVRAKICPRVLWPTAFQQHMLLLGLDLTCFLMVYFTRTHTSPLSTNYKNSYSIYIIFWVFKCIFLHLNRFPLFSMQPRTPQTKVSCFNHFSSRLVLFCLGEKLLVW